MLRALVLAVGLCAFAPQATSAQEEPSEATTTGEVDPTTEAEARRRYQRAEQERRAAERIRFVPPRRATTSDKLSRWVREYFTPTFTRRIDATRRAVAAYEQVQALGVTRYSIAGARRVGDLYLAIATTLERIPVPVDIRRDAQLNAIYQAAITDQAAPLREAAQDAYEACLRFAEQLGQTTGPHLVHARAELQTLAPDLPPSPPVAQPAP